jgi:hypothetical protein
MAPNDSEPQGEQGAVLSPAKQRLIEAHEQIVQQKPDRSDFLHTVMCQVGMPRKATDARVFERNSGPFSILLEAGKLWNGKQWIEQPLPYGTTPEAGDGASQFGGDPHQKPNH